VKSRITLILCIHNHQPVSARERVVKEICEKCYEPLVDLLESHSQAKFTLHYSGSLLERMPQPLIERLRQLVQNGQIELLSSGFYEPILPIIPFEDGAEQLLAYTHLLEQRFGRRPQGFWLAEKVWEPTIPALAVHCGLKYTLTDDTHFFYAGTTEEELNGYYVTDYQGSSTYVFPIAGALRHLMAYREPEDVIEYLRAFPDGSILVWADDGEKFGFLPETYQLVWGRKGRFRKLLNAVEKTKWIGLEHPSSVLATTDPKGRIYLPTSSGDEMDEWSLAAKRQCEYRASIESLKREGKYEDLRAFLRAGYFRNFLAKYPEANRAHKKMIYVSRKVHKMREKGKARAKRELWRGQENCVYWHQDSGGIYLPDLRDTVYAHLISAEVIADTEGRGRDFLQARECDFDCDGYNESLIETPLLNLYLHSVGGRIFELDYRPSSLNLLNTLARRKELYHFGIGKRPRPEKERADSHMLVESPREELGRDRVYDRNTRDSLIDHLLTPATTQQQFREMVHPEVVDLGRALYSSRLRQSESDVWLQLRRGSEKVNLVKTLSVNSKEAAVSVCYCLHSVDPSYSRFGVEFNLSLNQPSALFEPGREIRIVDRDKRIVVTFRFDLAPEIWIYPVETVSQTESGYELVYQGFCLMPVWTIRNGELETGIRLEISTC